GSDDAGGTLKVSSSTFSGNSASLGGGGIETDGSVTVTGTFGTVTVTGTVTVSDSTFTGNSALNGGGIFNFGVVQRGQASRSTLTVSHSTFSGNTATNHGGGIDNFGTATASGSTFTAT